jgi:hypothetical protein
MDMCQDMCQDMLGATRSALRYLDLEIFCHTHTPCLDARHIAHARTHSIENTFY